MPPFLLGMAWQGGVDVGVPSVSVIVTGFASLSAVGLIGLTIKNWDDNRTVRQAIFGPPEAPERGLIKQVERIAERVEQVGQQITAMASTLDVHCQDEREIWKEVEASHASIRQDVTNAAQVVTGQAQNMLTERFDALARKVDTLAERRETPRDQREPRRPR